MHDVKWFVKARAEKRYSRAIARSLGIAGDPGGLFGDIITLGSRVCCTVIVCLKSDGKLMFVPGSFFSNFNLDRLNLPEMKKY